MYVASIPLTDDKSSSKDGPKKSLVFLELEGNDHHDDHHLFKRADIAASEYAFAAKEQLREDGKEKKTLTDEKSRKTRDTAKHDDKPKTEKHRIVRDTPKDKDPKRVVRDIPQPNPHDPSHQAPKPSSIEKRDTGKDQSKHFDGEHSAGDEHNLEKRSNDKDTKHVDNKDDKHTVEKRAADKAQEKKPEKKPKREAKESKPDPKVAKNLPPKTSASSAKGSKN